MPNRQLDASNTEDPEPVLLRRAYQRMSRIERRQLQRVYSAVGSWTDHWERRARKWSERDCVVDIVAGRRWTFDEVNQAAETLARFVVARGDLHVGIHLESGVHLIIAVIGCLKAGAIPVLLNFREPVAKKVLLLRGCGVRTILGEDLGELRATSVGPLLDAIEQGPLLAPLRASVTLDSTAAIIFTSGTSGQSKAALFSHRRLIGAGIAWSLRTRISRNSRCYVCIPMYHGNGLAVAFASCVEAGACTVIRPRFAAARFWEDVRKHGCDCAVYVGELWRYLLERKHSDSEVGSLRMIFGNGLNAALWSRTIARFGIRHVVEHYGATEMPAGALTNWVGKPGACGFIPPGHPDAEHVLVVDEAGLPVGPGEAGELLLRIEGDRYAGYLDPELNGPKMWRDLRMPGDLWWRSGDRLRWCPDGFFYFADRLGDSFRWKGENVSTAEVEQALLATGLVAHAMVYGVEVAGHPGRAGMAAIVPASGKADALLSDTILHTMLSRRLAPYAIPQFIRILSHRPELTATLKTIKKPLASLGLRPSTEPVYVLCESQYVPLIGQALLDVMNGTMPRRNRCAQSSVG